jgi:hypothetical protein
MTGLNVKIHDNILTLKKLLQVFRQNLLLVDHAFTFRIAILA